MCLPGALPHFLSCVTELTTEHTLADAVHGHSSLILTVQRRGRTVNEGKWAVWLLPEAHRHAQA